LDIAQTAEESIAVSGQNDVARLAGQGRAVHMPDSAIKNIVIGTLKNDGGKTQLWDFDPADQTTLRQRLLNHRSSTQKAVEFLIPLLLLHAGIQPVRAAVSENDEPGRKQDAFDKLRQGSHDQSVRLVHALR
jgi:hypothetical protein